MVNEIAVAMLRLCRGFLSQSGFVAECSICQDPCVLALMRSPSRPAWLVAARPRLIGVRFSCRIVMLIGIEKFVKSVMLKSPRVK